MKANNQQNLNLKRKTGEFFTDSLLAKYVATKIMELINPEYVIEPYAGEGELLIPFIEQNIACLANDISPKNVSHLQKDFANKDVKISNDDIIALERKEILTKWNLLDFSDSFLIYTNPPFGTSSTNKLASKKIEYESSTSRNLDINYSDLAKYGKGDLILPAIGKLLDIFSELKRGFLAFYGPLGLFCKRKRYNKLEDALLRDFTFLWGEIFPGDKFANVNKKKPIVVTLWRYQKDNNTQITDLHLFYKDGIIPFKKVPLLKEYWRYDTRKVIKGEIAVQGNDRFNVMAPKMFHLKVEKGGSELVPENLVKPLNLEFIPDELAIGLWSVVVGHRSLTKYPIYVDNAYVHIPNFFQKKVQEVLTLAICSILISELPNNYTNGKIGLDQSNNLVFGNKELTTGVNYLVNKYKHFPIDNFTIDSIIYKLSNINNEKELFKDIKRIIRDKIESNLEKIGYWGFIPIPGK